MPHNTPPCNAISTPFLQSTPFCLKSSSIPIDAKTFKAEDIRDDLIIKLENATVSESPDTKLNPELRLEYIQILLDSSVVLQKVSLQLSNLKDSAGELFYRKGCWSPRKIPFFLCCQVDLARSGITSSSCAAKLQPSKTTSNPLSSRVPQRTKSLVSLNPKAPRTLSSSMQCQSIWRKIGSGSEEEEEEGMFISSVGKDEEETVVWLNRLTTSFPSVLFIGPILAPENSTWPYTCGYIKHTSSALLADIAPQCLWSVQFATKSIPGAIKVKPDLILCVNDPLNKTTPNLGASYILHQGDIQTKWHKYIPQLGTKGLHSLYGPAWAPFSIGGLDLCPSLLPSPLQLFWCHPLTQLQHPYSCRHIFHPPLSFYLRTARIAWIWSYISLFSHHFLTIIVTFSHHPCW